MRVVQLTDSNIDEINNLMTNKDQKVVAKFYADWCGHCKDLNPKWNEMSGSLNDSKLSGLLASVSEKYKTDVDCDSEIMGYPTIRVFHGGRKKRDYNGKREAKDLVKFVRKTLGKKKRKTRRKKSRRRRRSRSKRKTRKLKRKNSFRDRFYNMISNH